VRICLLALVLLGGNCRCEPEAGPLADAAEPLVAPPSGNGHRDATFVGDAERLAIADLDGDGRGEIVAVGSDALRVLDLAGTELARAPASAGIQVLSVADLDGDGRHEIVAGWGRSRAHPSGRARVSIHRWEASALHEETVLEPATTRHEIVAIVPLGEDLRLAWFEGTHEVTSGIATRGATGWHVRDRITLRMATAWASGDLDGDGGRDWVVGRLYGDAKDQDGDAFVLAPSGARTRLPTTRGVRGLALADTDGDGRAEIFLGDGWHQDYGRRARALLTRVRSVDGAPRAEQVDELSGETAVWQIEAADLDGDGLPEIVARGDRTVRVYRRAGSAWRGLLVAEGARHFAIGDLDGGGDVIVVAGERSEVIDLRGLAW